MVDPQFTFEVFIAICILKMKVLQCGNFPSI